MNRLQLGGSVATEPQQTTSQTAERQSDLGHLCLSPPDSKAIVDGNLKLILGLVWTLILHYSISMPMWEGEDEEVTHPVWSSRELRVETSER